MLKRLRLCHKINKFYKLYSEVLDYEPDRVRLSDLSNADCLISVGFDVAQILEGYDYIFDPKTYPIERWLNKLYREVMAL